MRTWEESTSGEATVARGLPAAVGAILGFNNVVTSSADWLFSGSLSRFPKYKHSEEQAGSIPYVLERAAPVWELHAVRLPARVRIPGLASTQCVGRIFGYRTADRHGVGSLAEGDICLGTDDLPTDTTWPYSEATIEKR